jgi:outer membrane protein assembly factor BamE
MQKYSHTFLILLTLLTSGAALTGCQISFPYKAPIQQGNVITPAMLTKLKPGMSAEHVRYVLGEPILVPTFHPNRWEYIYTLQPSHGNYERRLVTVYFSNGTMERVVTELPKKLPAKKR